MTMLSFPSWLHALKTKLNRAHVPRSSLSALAKLPDAQLPKFVRESEVALKYLQLLGMLDWLRFLDRPDQRFLPDEPPIPYAPFVAAYLVKIDQHIPLCRRSLAVPDRTSCAGMGIGISPQTVSGIPMGI